VTHGTVYLVLHVSKAYAAHALGGIVVIVAGPGKVSAGIVANAVVLGVAVGSFEVLDGLAWLLLF
jgi:hypothetical protein